MAEGDGAQNQGQQQQSGQAQDAQAEAKKELIDQQKSSRADKERERRRRRRRKKAQLKRLERESLQKTGGQFPDNHSSQERGEKVQPVQNVDEPYVNPYSSEQKYPQALKKGEEPKISEQKNFEQKLPEKKRRRRRSGKGPRPVGDNIVRSNEHTPRSALQQPEIQPNFLENDAGFPKDPAQDAEPVKPSESYDQIQPVDSIPRSAEGAEPMGEPVEPAAELTEPSVEGESGSDDQQVSQDDLLEIDENHPMVHRTQSFMGPLIQPDYSQDNQPGFQDGQLGADTQQPADIQTEPQNFLEPEPDIEPVPELPAELAPDTSNEFTEQTGNAEPADDTFLSEDQSGGELLSDNTEELHPVIEPESAPALEPEPEALAAEPGETESVLEPEPEPVPESEVLAEPESFTEPASDIQPASEIESESVNENLQNQDVVDADQSEPQPIDVEEQPVVEQAEQDQPEEQPVEQPIDQQSQDEQPVEVFPYPEQHEVEQEVLDEPAHVEEVKKDAEKAEFSEGNKKTAEQQEASKEGLPESEGLNVRKSFLQSAGAFSAGVFKNIGSTFHNLRLKFNVRKLGGFIVLMIIGGGLYAGYVFKVHESIYNYVAQFFKAPPPVEVQLDEELLREWGIITSYIAGDNRGSVNDLLAVQVWDAYYFGYLGEPKVQGETGITPAYFYGKNLDIKSASNRFIIYVQVLRELVSTYDVDIYQMLDQTVDRDKALNDHLAKLKAVLTKSEEIQREINAGIDDLKVSVDSITGDRNRYETDFFAALQGLAGEKADFLMKSFIDVSQKQIALKAHLAALQKLSGYFETSLARLSIRITAVEKNYKILVQGIHVVDIPGANLDIIIKETP